jgi:hypothetical protein
MGNRQLGVSRGLRDGRGGLWGAEADIDMFLQSMRTLMVSRGGSAWETLAASRPCAVPCSFYVSRSNSQQMGFRKY